MSGLDRMKPTFDAKDGKMVWYAAGVNDCRQYASKWFRQVAAEGYFR